MRLRNKRFLLRAGQGRSMRLWPIFLAILAWASPAAAEWRQAQSSHFIIYSKDSEEALRQFATRLERFEGAMRAIHGLPDLDPGPANRIDRKSTRLNSSH